MTGMDPDHFWWLANVMKGGGGLTNGVINVVGMGHSNEENHDCA